MIKRRVLWIGGAVTALGLVSAAVVLFRDRYPTVGERLQDPSPAVRAAAIRSLGWHPDPDLMIRALRDENADVRLLAAERLEGMGPKMAERIEALLAALRDPHAGVRREAAEALCSIGSESGPALWKALQDEDPLVRAGAALALGPACPHKEERERAPGEEEVIVPLLSKLLKDKVPEVRRSAAQALGRIDMDAPRAQVAVPALIASLKDEDARVREEAAWALRGIARPECRAAVPGLRAALRDEDKKVRSAAEWALKELEPAARVDGQ